MALAIVTLLAALAWSLHTAPVPTLAAGAVLGTALFPEAAAFTVGSLTALVIGTAALVLATELRATGGRVLLIRC
jgi:hypothetical protein